MLTFGVYWWDPSWVIADPPRWTPWRVHFWGPTGRKKTGWLRYTDFRKHPYYIHIYIYIYMVADTQEADLCHCQQTSRLLKTLTTREVYLLITVQNAFIPQDPKSAYYCLIFYWGNCYCAGIYWATPWNLLGYTLEFIGLRPGTTYILYSPFPLTPPSIKHIPRSIGLELFFFKPYIYIYIQHIYIYI